MYFGMFSGDALVDFLLFSYLMVTVVYNTVTHRWKEYFKEGWYGMNCPECLNAMWNLKITKIFRVALVVILQGIIDFVSLSVQMIKGRR